MPQTVIVMEAFFFFSFVGSEFLHKTTWREYFDAQNSEKSERCLCAPFFILFFHLIIVHGLISTIVTRRLFKDNMLFSLLILTIYEGRRKHDVNILTHRILRRASDVCVLRFFFFFRYQIVPSEVTNKHLCTARI